MSAYVWGSFVSRVQMIVRGEIRVGDYDIFIRIGDCGIFLITAVAVLFFHAVLLLHVAMIAFFAIPVERVDVYGDRQGIGAQELGQGRWGRIYANPCKTWLEHCWALHTTRG